jgi:hypothetical protein
MIVKLKAKNKPEREEEQDEAREPTPCLAA